MRQVDDEEDVIRNKSIQQVLLIAQYQANFIYTVLPIFVICTRRTVEYVST